MLPDSNYSIVQNLSQLCQTTLVATRLIDIQKLIEVCIHVFICLIELSGVVVVLVLI